MELEHVSSLWFDTGAPVRAASAVAPLGDGWLIVQDDATHAGWRRPAGTSAVRVVPPIDGHETFSSAAGTKHLKPDFEAAAVVPVDGSSGVLLLGSGSTPARMRASLVTLGATGPEFVVADLTPVYREVAGALGLPADRLNLEGACVLGDRLRWFQRGNSAAGVPSAAVDVDLAALLAVVTGRGTAERVATGDARSYDLGAVAGVALAVTDAVPLPDGRVLVSAAAEDTPNAVDDGPVVGAALAVLDDNGVRDATALPVADGGDAYKVEGLAVSEVPDHGLRLMAVVDADDPDAASTQLILRVWW
ncbi:MAG TPA: hypothetical protein VF657_01065 [Actinoplanes sp.]